MAWAGCSSLRVVSIAGFFRVFCFGVGDGIQLIGDPLMEATGQLLAKMAKM